MTKAAERIKNTEGMLSCVACSISPSVYDVL